MPATKQVALLRGINLGRNKRIAMSELRELVRGLGYADAITHLQSGNVVFTGTGKASEKVARELAKAIEDKFGMPVGVLVRSRDELAAVVDRNPLPQHADDPARLLVTFLATEPDRTVLGEIDAATYAPDEFVVSGREIYLYLPKGVQGSKLSNEFWEKRVGRTATTRNWNTVTKLLDLAST